MGRCFYVFTILWFSVLGLQLQALDCRLEIQAMDPAGKPLHIVGQTFTMKNVLEGNITKVVLPKTGHVAIPCGTYDVIPGIAGLESKPKRVTLPLLNGSKTASIILGVELYSLGSRHNPILTVQVQGSERGQHSGLTVFLLPLFSGNTLMYVLDEGGYGEFQYIPRGRYMLVVRDGNSMIGFRESVEVNESTETTVELRSGLSVLLVGVESSLRGDVILADP